MDQNSARIANLSPQKLALLAQRFRDGRQVSKTPIIEPRERETDIPLSFAQQRLWFIDQLEPNSPAYNMPAPVRLTGKLDLEAFRRSIQTIVRRHESLRTTFQTVEGKPVQTISTGLELPIPVIDLSHLSETECLVEARRLATVDGMVPFDLSTGPLVRTTLLRFGEEDHALLLTMHHIISDGWSFGVFYRELRMFYEAYTDENVKPLPELPIQYADYALWQREWLKSSVLESQLAYWKRQLQGAPPMLNLPLDRPRPEIQSACGALLPVSFTRPLTAALRALAQREECTLFMTVLAAFQALLHCYTGSLDIVVGSNVANRTRQQTEELIGFFINQLVMRTDLTGDPSFVELLARVREVALGAYANQDVPFERVVEVLKPERSLSRQPLFQVKIDLQNAPVSSLHLPGFTLRSLGMEITTTHTDITLSLLDSEEQMTGFLQYSTDIFNEATMRNLIHDFKFLMETVAARSEIKLGELSEAVASEKLKQRAAQEQEYSNSARQKLMSKRRRATTVEC
jgi:hypothetical protein